MQRHQDRPAEVSPHPDPPPGWELDVASDPAQEQEDEEVRPLAIPRLPLWLMRMFRRFRRFRPAAREEWLAYYQGLYTSRSPDADLFARLLAHNGAWDIPSPFVPGSRQAYSFCPAGVLLADVVFLLDRWSLHVMDQGQPFFEAGQKDPLSGEDEVNPYLHAVQGPSLHDSSYPLSQDSASPIHHHIAMQARADACRQLDHAAAAARCLMTLFLDHSSQWAWMADHLHVDNRILICKIVHDVGSIGQRRRLAANWQQAGWLSASAASRLLSSTDVKAAPPNQEKE